MKALKPGCKPLGLGLRPLKLDLRPMKPGLRPLRPSWRPLRPSGGGDGRTYVRTDRRTDRTKSPYSKGHRFLRGRCPKRRKSAQAIKKESDKEMTFKKDFSFCDFLRRDKRWSSEILDIGNPRLSHKDA